MAKQSFITWKCDNKELIQNHPQTIHKGFWYFACDRNIFLHDNIIRRKEKAFCWTYERYAFYAGWVEREFKCWVNCMFLKCLKINTVYTEQYFNNMSETQMQNFNFDKGVSY